MDSIKEISKAINNLKSDSKVYNFLLEILTESEVETLSKRWRIVNMLMQGKSQREISKELKVSLCKVTRGAKILKSKNSVTKEIIKEIKHGS